MKLTKLLIVGAVALTGLVCATAAQAHDDRHDDRHDGHYHHHYDRGSGYYYYRQPGYYQQPGVVYADPGYGYYGGSNSVTFAFGGHRFYHHRYHR